MGCSGMVDGWRAPTSNDNAPATVDSERPAPEDAAAPILQGTPPATPASTPSAADEELAASPPDLTVLNKCAATTARGGARQAVRRLLKSELASALPSVVGGGYFEIEPLLQALPEAYEVQPGESFQPLHSLGEVEAWIDIAEAASESFVKYGHHQNFGPNYCLSEAKPSDACLETAVRGLVGTAFRRPLESADVERYVAVLQEQLAMGSVERAFAQLLVQVLLAPQFLFHLESGEASEPLRMRISDHDVANRIAFAISNAPPDEDLREAASNGALKSLTQVDAQVRRLLSKPEARKNFERYVHEWLNLRKVVDPPRTLGQVAGFMYDSAGGLSISLERELQDYVSYIVWSQNGSFADLMTAPIAFPTEERAAIVYRTAQSVNGIPVNTPDHPGLLTRAALLTNSVEVTSPIMRGVNVLRRVLCDAMPSPDFSIVQERLTSLGAHDHMKQANWEIVQDTTSPAICTGCHKRINPIGFLLEEFDALGRSQTVENVYGVDTADFHAKSLLMHELPPVQQDVSIGADPPRSFANAADLSKAIGDNRQARECFAVRLFRFVQRRPEKEQDACALRDTADRLAGDAPIYEALVAAVANEDIFWRAVP